ncbi:MAG: PQQ-binding-like beta-propeller repeat protein [Planctomycetaceae bacterium]|jgi:hypothetical protein|nr:PQQ-binding-like beta-propeller repeat protein [Planctomycetaceae bacterium]
MYTNDNLIFGSLIYRHSGKCDVDQLGGVIFAGNPDAVPDSPNNNATTHRIVWNRNLFFFVLVLIQFILIQSVLNFSFVGFLDAGQLISQRRIDRIGLVRVWYNQLPVVENVAELRYVTLEGNTLFAVTSDARINAIDTATGKLLWSQPMGRRELQYQAPAANSRVVAVVNNIELFVFDRKTGKLLLYTELPNSIALTACEVSENYVYIPMQGGRIIVYPIEEGSSEKILNLKTGEFEDPKPVTVKPPIPQENLGDHVAGVVIPKKENPMKANIHGDLDKRDEVVDEIITSFAETKYSILAKPEVPAKEPQLVLKPPLNFPISTISFGDVTIQPRLVSQVIKSSPDNKEDLGMHWEILTWISGKGNFHAATIRDLSQIKMEQLYRVNPPAKIFRPEKNQIAERDWEIDREIVVRPAVNQSFPYDYSGISFERWMIPSLSVVGSKSRYVFAIKDRNGEVMWHFVANDAIVEQIAVIGLEVFAPTRLGLYSIDLLTGKERWYISNIRKFIAASKTRIYARDNRGYLVIVDRRTGSRLAYVDIREYKDVLFNTETDRIFVIDKTGLIQCLAERQVDAKGEGFNLRNRTKPVTEVRHRLSAAQYMDFVRGVEVPQLYWMVPLGLDGKIQEKDKNKKSLTDKDNLQKTDNKSPKQTDQTTEDENQSTDNNNTTEDENQSTDDKPTDETESTDDKPTDETESTDNKPNNETESTDDKPTDETESTDDKPTDETESTDDKPTDETESTDNKPNNETEPTDDKPTDETESTDDKPTDETESTDDKPTDETESTGDT